MTNTISGTNIFISSMYLSRKHKLFLKALLAAISKNKDITWIYVDVLDDKCEQAALLVDIDDPKGKKYWEDSIKQKTPSNVVAFTSANGLSEKYPMIHKPFRSKELFSVLLNTVQVTSSDVKPKIDETPAKVLPAQEMVSKKIKPDTVINTQRKNLIEAQKISEKVLVLQYILCKQEVFIEIIDDDKKIFVNYKKGLCFSNAETELLSNIFLKPVASVNLKEVSCFDDRIVQYQVSKLDLEPVLWHAIINCHKEQLFESISNNTPVKLKKWPDYKFLMKNPNHMKLSAILSKHWSNAQNLVQDTNISLLNVNKFINACYGLGYLIFDESKVITSNNNFIKLNQKNNKKSLFGKIRKRLGI